MKRCIERLRLAYGQDPEIVVERKDVENTLGSDPGWLNELGLEKQDLLRLERMGFAIKARYVISKSKVHRVRWILLKEALQ